MTNVLSSSDPQVRGPATAKLCEAILAVWPAHEKFITKSFAQRSPELLGTTEFIAGLFLEYAAQSGVSLGEYAADYRFLCEEIVFPEELFFAREGRYRLSTFEDAAREVYDNPPLMK